MPPVCLVLLGLRVIRDLLELLVPLEFQDTESQVQMVRRERGEPQVAQVPQVQRESRAQQVILGLLVPLAQWVHLDLKVKEVSLEPLALLVLKVTQVQVDLRDLRDTREIREHRVSKANRVIQGQLVLLDPEGPLDLQVTKVMVVPQVPQVLQVSQGLLDPKDTLVALVSQVPLDLMDLQVPEDLLDHKDLLVLLALRDIQVSLDLLVLLVWLQRVFLDLRVPLVNPVSPEVMESPAPLALLVPLDLLVRLSSRRAWD